MQTKEVLFELRKKHELTQEEFAQRLLVTRQAVSRWETGETVPNTDTLKLIAKEFEVSIDALLGQPHDHICQSCGMPLTDNSLLGTEQDSSLNTQYCKWCYADGAFTYDCTMEEMIESCIPHLSGWDPDEARTFMRNNFPQLARWRS